MSSSPPAKVYRKPTAVYGRMANRGRTYGSSVAARQAAAIAFKPKVLSDSSSDDDAPGPSTSSKSSGRTSQALKTGPFPPVTLSTPTSSRKGKRKAATATAQEDAIDWKTVSNATQPASTSSRTSRSKRARAGEEEADKPEDKATSPTAPSKIKVARNSEIFVDAEAPAATASKSTSIRQRLSTAKTVEAPKTSSMAKADNTDTLPRTRTTRSRASIGSQATTYSADNTDTLPRTRTTRSRASIGSVLAPDQNSPSQSTLPVPPVVSPSVQSPKPARLANAAMPLASLSRLPRGVATAHSLSDSPSALFASQPRPSTLSPRPATPTTPRAAAASPSSMITPTRPPRDVSALFATHSAPDVTATAIASPSTEDEALLMINPLRQSQGGGVVRRMMLQRSTTALDAVRPSATVSPLRKTSSWVPSAPATPSNSIPTAVAILSAPESPMLGSPRGAASSQTAAPPKRTYGGERTMLASMTDVNTLERAESYSALARRWGVTDEDEDDEDMADLPTITELRARGENQRFLDDLGYIIDGIKGQGISVRRPSAVDLVRRLLNPDFRRSIKTLDEALPVYNVLREAGAGEGDAVLDASLGIFVAILAKYERIIEPILLQDGQSCMEVVGRMMRRKEDGFAKAEKKISIKDRPVVNLTTELARIYDLSGVGLTSAASVSLVRILSCFLALVVKTDLNPRIDALGLLEAAELPAVLADVLQAEIKKLAPRLEGHEKGLPLLPRERPPDLELIANCISVLEGSLVRSEVVRETIDKSHQDLPSLLGTVLAVCNCLVELQKEGDDEDAELLTISTSTLLMTLRALVNLTNISSTWASSLFDCSSVVSTLLRLINSSRLSLLVPSDVSSPLTEPSSPPLRSSSPLIKDEAHTAEEQAATREALKVDTLCLSLGLLNNLVESGPDAKDRVRTTEIAKTCPGVQGCVVRCRCPTRRSALLSLVDFYAEQHLSSTIEATYLAGYTTLLLSHLIATSPENATIVLTSLPLGTKATNLEAMIAELRNFVDVHQRFFRKLTEITAEASAADNDIGIGGTQEVLSVANAAPAVVPSVEEGIGAVQRMMGLLEGLREKTVL